MRIAAGASSDIGLVREANEDSLLAEPPVFAVADGMGGHRGGEVASALALETLRQVRGPLADQVREANRVVFERSLSDRALSGMGTTLTAAVAEETRVRLAHVGDSRAYLWRDGRLRRLTEDHTLVNQMVKEGKITEQEATVHPQRSILTRALGVDRDVRVDEDSVDVLDQDRILLCSDGLTAMVGDGQIASVLAQAADPQEAADLLARAANEAGGIDNITALVVDFRGGDEPPGDGDRSAESPRPAAEPRRPSLLERGARLGLALAAAVAIAVVALVGLRLYVDGQWFVGVSDGRVALFRGIPAEVAGFKLHHVVVETEVQASEIEQLALWRDRLRDGITAPSRDDAEEIVDQMRADLAKRAREAAQGPNG